MAYVVYFYEEERFDVVGYFDIDNYKAEDYRIVYEGCFDECIDYLERL